MGNAPSLIPANAHSVGVRAGKSPSEDCTVLSITLLRFKVSVWFCTQGHGEWGLIHLFSSRNKLPGRVGPEGMHPEEKRTLPLPRRRRVAAACSCPVRGSASRRLAIALGENLLPASGGWGGLSHTSHPAPHTPQRGGERIAPKREGGAFAHADFSG